MQRVLEREKENVNMNMNTSRRSGEVPSYHKYRKKQHLRRNHKA